MKKVMYYSRPNCMLCEEGLQTMQLVADDVAFELAVVDIESDDALHEQYMLMIPVVVVDGEVVQYGQLDYPTILTYLLEHS